MLSARLILATVVTFVPMMLEGSDGLPMAGDRPRLFLRDARIVSVKPIEVGITKPMKITLTDGEADASRRLEEHRRESSLRRFS